MAYKFRNDVLTIRKDLKNDYKIVQKWASVMMYPEKQIADIATNALDEVFRLKEVLKLTQNNYIDKTNIEMELEAENKVLKQRLNYWQEMCFELNKIKELNITTTQ